MVFVDDIAKVSEQVRKRAELVTGEESTKMALIVPFFSALGYDVSDPAEVIPEFVADFATKKSGQFEKVDYAIAINGVIVMVVEAKARDKKPEAHDGQLKKYFNALIATRVAIVTNGVEYRFFTDLRHDNVMDDEPFFSFNVLEYDSKHLENLKFFHRDNFDSAIIKRHAEEMVYLKGMTHLVDNLLRSPPDEFVRFLVSQLSSIAPSCTVEGRITNKVINKFRPIIKKSIQSSLVELMTQSISREMGQAEENLADQAVEIEETQDEQEQDLEEVKVDTTAEELEAFEKVKSIATRSECHSLEVKYKDVISYFGLNVGKTTWWFLRFYLSPKKKSFVTRLTVNEVKALAPNFEVQEMSASMGDAASRVIISSVNDLDNLSDLILKCYEAETARHSASKAA